MHPLFMLRKTTILIAILLSWSYFCPAQDVPLNQLTLPAANHKIPFIWLEGKDNAYMAMLIPVKLRGCPKTFYMQFDTGSPYSLFYRNKLKAIGIRYLQSVQIADTTEKLWQFQFHAGKMAIHAKEIAVRQFDSTGINWNSNTVEIIGTLGTDLIDNKVMTINYPDKYISITNKAMQQEDVELSGFIYERRRILLPVSIKGKKNIIYFDTGSSA